VLSSARVRTWSIVGLGAVLTLVAVAGYQSSKGPHSQDEQIAYQSGYSNGYQGFSGTFLAEVNSEDDCNQLAIQEIGVTVSQMHQDWGQDEIDANVRWYVTGCTQGLDDRTHGRTEREFPQVR
jgi:hypothetical protein